MYNQIWALSELYEPGEPSWEYMLEGTRKGYNQVARREYREGLVSGLNRKVTELKNAEKESQQGQKITALAIRSEDIANAWLMRQCVTLNETTYSSNASYSGTSEHHSQGVDDSKHLTMVRGGIEE